LKPAGPALKPAGPIVKIQKPGTDEGKKKVWPN